VNISLLAKWRLVSHGLELVLMLEEEVFIAIEDDRWEWNRIMIMFL
jgi:hypothetical protein